MSVLLVMVDVITLVIMRRGAITVPVILHGYDLGEDLHSCYGKEYKLALC